MHLTNHGKLKVREAHLAGQRQTCALDLAERPEPLNLTQIGALLGRTGEAIRLIEAQALAKVRAYFASQGIDARFYGEFLGRPGD